MDRPALALSALAAGALAFGTAQALSQEAAPNGAELYVNAGCVSCHGGDGEGRSGPALGRNPALRDTALVVRQILDGGSMPAFRDRLSDAEIAAIITYMRVAWGPNAGPVTPAEVAATRAGG